MNFMLIDPSDIANKSSDATRARTLFCCSIWYPTVRCSHPEPLYLLYLEILAISDHARSTLGIDTVKGIATPVYFFPCLLSNSDPLVSPRVPSCPLVSPRIVCAQKGAPEL